MYEITYTTNLDDRHTVKREASSKTEAYLNFIRDNPIHYIITDMKKIA